MLTSVHARGASRPRGDVHETAFAAAVEALSRRRLCRARTPQRRFPPSNLDEPKVCEGREAEAGTGRPIATATERPRSGITESSQHALRRE